MRRAFWFCAGVGVGVFVIIKGREYYRRLTPAGVAERLERQVGEATEQAASWVADFWDVYRQSRRAKTAELLGLLQHDEGEHAS